MGDKLKKEAPDFTIDLIRYTLLMNSIYVAVSMLLMLPGFINGVSEGTISGFACLVLSIVALAPPCIVVHLAPLVIKDFVMVANIESMKNNRVLEQGVRRMRTRNAFLSLKVAYMMLRGVTGGSERVSSIVRRESETSTLHKRAVWKMIFDVFDEDGGGELTHEEIALMLRSACGSKMSTTSINKIIESLDQNHDGSIDFEEFFQYALKISEESVDSPEEIANGIFELVDQGSRHLVEESKAADASDDESSSDEEDEDEIDISELQAAIAKMKQELSADDVYSVIKDIDEDGNGRLNKEEFTELLKRLDVI